MQPESPTDPDPHRLWRCKPSRAARPLPKEEEEKEGAITNVKQSHGSLPERRRLWGAISSWGKLAVGGQSTKATQEAPPKARDYLRHLPQKVIFAMQDQAGPRAKR